MPCFINPGGRIVEVDDPKQIAELEASHQFKRLSEAEEQSWRIERQVMVEDMKSHAIADNSKGIYLATVSEGGKDGYGIASSRLIAELRNLGIPVSTHNEGQRLGILFHNPYSILRMETPLRVIYTMFESTKIPDDWKDYLEAADLIIVPSKWCQAVFKKAGFKTVVVPLGYDDRVFKFKQRVNKRKERKDFVFLHYNAFNIRKGFAEVWTAFNKEFRKDEPVRLVLKTTLRGAIPLPITKAMYPNVDIINESIPEEKLADLCGEADCFVYPSRGEGFGMTPLEAMATGLPTIVPNAHGISEYFDSQYMYEVSVKDDKGQIQYCPALYSRYKNQDVGKMYVSNIDDLRKKMRFAYEHQDEGIELGKKASEYVKRFTFKQTAEQLKKVLEELLARPASEKPLHNVLRMESV